MIKNWLTSTYAIQLPLNIKRWNIKWFSVLLLSCYILYTLLLYMCIVLYFVYSTTVQQWSATWLWCIGRNNFIFSKFNFLKIYFNLAINVWNSFIYNFRDFYHSHDFVAINFIKYRDIVKKIAKYRILSQ